jgi:hypothetical protein
MRAPTLLISTERTLSGFLKGLCPAMNYSAVGEHRICPDRHSLASQPKSSTKLAGCQDGKRLAAPPRLANYPCRKALSEMSVRYWAPSNLIWATAS